jgi:hypothetical protein
MEGNFQLWLWFYIRDIQLNAAKIRPYIKQKSSHISEFKATKEKDFFVVFPRMLIITQLLFQQNALVYIKSTRYYNLYFLSLYS